MTTTATAQSTSPTSSGSSTTSEATAPAFLLSGPWPVRLLLLLLHPLEWGSELTELRLEQSNNIAVTGSTFNNNQFGINAIGGCSNVNVADAKFTKQTTAGIRLIDTVSGTFSGNTVSGNYWGIDLMGGTTSIKSTQNVLINNQQEALLIGGVAGNRIWDNKFNNWHNVRFVSPGANARISPNAETNAQPEYAAGPNIIGKMVIGGNFWAQPDMMGWSQITYDVADDYGNVGPDDICDWPFGMTPTNVDNFPLHQ